MARTYPNVNTLWAHVLVDELARCGLRYCVVSPGSRSTPLAVAVADHPDITDFSVLDERSAAFFALGLAKRSGLPVALVCTSGTAAANYLPAVCEASHAHVPLIVLTADRPPHLQAAGAPQTMDQLKLYGDQVRWFHNVAQPEADEFKLRSLRSTACHAVAVATGTDGGPVHLNLGFRKPLEPVEDPAGIPVDFFDVPGPGLDGRPDGRPFTGYRNCLRDGYQQIIEELADELRRHTRIMIVAGPDATGGSYAGAVNAFAAENGIPVLAEANSQLRSGESGEWILGAAGLFLRNERCRAIAEPTMILRFGSAATVKPVQDFLATPGPLQVVISRHGERIDPDFTAAYRIVTDETALLDALRTVFARLPIENQRRDWTEALQRMNREAATALRRELNARDDMFEGHVYHDLVTVLPAGSAMFVSNSMPVRDLETFLPELPPGITIWCNRGLNGIDGVTSSAMGIARAGRGHTVLVTGDVAFLHDLGGLPIARRADVDMTIVVVNNNGGEIFGTLPIGHFEPVFTRHFQTPHGMTMRHAADLVGATYFPVRDRAAFSAAVRESTDRGGLNIVEVLLPERAGIPSRKAVFAGIGTSLDALAEDLTTGLQDYADSPAGFPLAVHRVRHGDDAIPLVLLHGFSRDARMWSALASMLDTPSGILAVDLMGHGSSPSPAFELRPDAWTIEYNAERLFEALQRSGVGHCHLAGYSMGGRVAMHAALQHPERFYSLALISASPGIEDAEERARRLDADQRLADNLEKDGLEAFVEAWLRSPIFEGIRRLGPAAVHAARAERLRQSARGLAASLRGMGQGAQSPLWGSLRALTMPVLLVAGSHDEKYRAYGDIMRTLIPRARLEIITDAGHDVAAESPRALADAMNAFLGTRRGRSSPDEHG